MYHKLHHASQGVNKGRVICVQIKTTKKYKDNYCLYLYGSTPLFLKSGVEAGRLTVLYVFRTPNSERLVTKGLVTLASWFLFLTAMWLVGTRKKRGNTSNVSQVQMFLGKFFGRQCCSHLLRCLTGFFFTFDKVRLVLNALVSRKKCLLVLSIKVTHDLFHQKVNFLFT